MKWDLTDINERFLRGQNLTATPEELVQAFDRCGRMLGPEWFDWNYGNNFGALPTMNVLNMSTKLTSLEGLANSTTITDKLKAHDLSALAELHALHLLRSTGDVEIEIEPPLTVEGKAKKPDFRIRRAGEAWTYAEVTKPETSELGDKASQLLCELNGLMTEITRPFELEVYFLREPSIEERSEIVKEVRSFCSSNTVGEMEIKDGLAIVALSGQPPDGAIAPNDHGRPDSLCRVCQATVQVENGVHTKKISVRLPLTDERAELFIQRKSKQLPEQGPGIMMIDMFNVLGGFKHWEPFILRRFQPKINKRISAVCLFGGGIFLGDDGPFSLSQTKVLVNPFATTPAPNWLCQSLIQQGVAYDEEIQRRCSAG